MTIPYGILLIIVGLSIFHWLRYTVVAGGTYLLFWRKFRGFAESRRLQPQPGGANSPAFSRAQLRREFWNSTKSSVLFGVIFAPMLSEPTRSFTKVYSDASLHGPGYIVLTFVFLMLLQDTYFYWMHRLIHHPNLFKKIHSVHHESRSPNPLTAYSFSVSEGVLEFIWVWPVVLLMPVHGLTLALFGLTALVFNIVGHLGFEFYPANAGTHPLLKWLNRPTYHDEHHRRATGNYGLYFVFWDRWMGTLKDKPAPPHVDKAGVPVTARVMKTAN